MTMDLGTALCLLPAALFGLVVICATVAVCVIEYFGHRRKLMESRLEHDKWVRRMHTEVDTDVE